MTKPDKVAAEPKPGYRKSPFNGPDIQCPPPTSYIPEPIADWETRLLGKKIIRKWEAVPSNIDPDNVQYYLEADLPEPYRVIAPYTGYGFDDRTDRLNIDLDSDGKAFRVHYD